MAVSRLCPGVLALVGAGAWPPVEGGLLRRRSSGTSWWSWLYSADSVKCGQAMNGWVISLISQDSASEISLFDLSDPVSRQTARFEAKPQLLWNPGLSNRIRAWERTRPQEKRQRNIRWVQDAGRGSAVSPRSRCGEEQGKGQAQRQNVRDAWCRILDTSSVPRLVCTGGIIPQGDGKRRRSHTEGLPVCQPAV